MYLKAVLRQDVGFFDTQATTGGLLQGLNEDSLVGAADGLFSNARLAAARCRARWRRCRLFRGLESSGRGGLPGWPGRGVFVGWEGCAGAWGSFETQDTSGGLLQGLNEDSLVGGSNRRQSEAAG